MINSVILDEREQEYVVRAIESSLQISKKHQLYLWTQGLFHGLVPHDVLIGLQFDELGKTIQVECVTSSLIEEDSYRRICDPNVGMAVRMARHCQTNEIKLPFSVPVMTSSLQEEMRLGVDLKACGLQSAIIHGRQSTRGGGWDYYVLFRRDLVFGERHGYFMELLMPYLHSTFHRVMIEGSDEYTPAAVGIVQKSNKLLSERELEIMHWVREGKSNQEIGTILNISQLTVKNHVQNILKKLKVQNRAQAVSHAISLRLLNKAH